MVMAGPVPPPEKVKGTLDALGENVPSPFLANVASIDVHAPFFLTRTGTAFDVKVNVPSGFAITLVVSEVRDVTSTAAPDAFAAAEAASSSDRWGAAPEGMV
jgi:hypothetical protein